MVRRLLTVVALCCAPAVYAAPPAIETQTGMASYYSGRFEGRRTASGEVFRNDALTAAHATFPFGTLVRVTTGSGDFVDVRITDRLPARQAIIDLTQRAAAKLDMLRAGKLWVTVHVLEWGRGAQQALRRVASDTPGLSDVIHAIEGSSPH